MALLVGVSTVPMQAAAVTSFDESAWHKPSASHVAPRAFAVEDIRVSGEYVWKANGKADVRVAWRTPAEHADDSLTFLVTLYRDDTGGPLVRGFSTKAQAVRLRNLKPEHSYGVEVQVKGQAIDGVPYYSAFNFTVPTPPTPEGPPIVSPWVVSLGDSFISGEGARWAGNADELGFIDRGRSIYYDSWSKRAELIDRCHRSTSALVHFGIGVPGYRVQTKNFACSGAITKSELLDSNGNPIPEGAATPDTIIWKPGIDFYEEEGRIGQAEMLRRFAQTHDVRMVILSIGGNDFHFADIVTDCVTDFLFSPFRERCEVDPETQAYVNPAAVQRVTADIKGAVLNIAQAMSEAGIEDDSWTLVQALYPKPMADESDIRYPEDMSRQSVGGCGMFDSSIDWATGPLLTTINDAVKEAGRLARIDRPGLQLVTMDTSNAFRGHELCSKYAARIGDDGRFVDRNLPYEDDTAVPWWSDRAVNFAEWVMDINVTQPGEAMKQENFHPNYWGQLALRNCYRSAWNGGSVRGGVCVPGRGLNAYNEPQMTFSPAP